MLWGEVLRNIRLSRGELLYDMAANLGVKSSYLSSIELGEEPMCSVVEDGLKKKYGVTQRGIYTINRLLEIERRQSKVVVLM